MFALFSMNNGTRSNVPLVSYATLADIWFEVRSALSIKAFCGKPNNTKM